MLLAAALALCGSHRAFAEPDGKIVAPNATKYGNDYAGWSAAWWQWNLQLPVDGHPAIDSPDFDINAGQSGDVWFLGAPFGVVERTATIPAGKALFIAVMNAECSSLEPEESGFHGDTAKEQRTCAKYWNDHNIALFCEIDGVAVKRLESYRVTSPQFTFTAPTPWIFGTTGGTGTAVGDGYYVLVTPLSKGQHTIHFGGILRFTLSEDGFDRDFPLDMTYHLTIE